MLQKIRDVPIPALFIEFLGTFFLVHTISLNVLNSNALAALSIGSVLMVTIFMGGYISGAHYNPAVTVAVFLRGKIPLAHGLFYILTQCVASFAAALAGYFIFDHTFALAPQDYGHRKVSSALWAEFIFTFILCSVVLHTATTKTQQGNSYFGLAIGFVVVSGAFAVGPISGGGFNPAVATGPAIVQALFGKGISGGSGRDEAPWIWIYWLAPIAAAVLAALLFRFVIRDLESEREEKQF
eukprot:TRINITY_DN4854_c0_g1_i1.p1 TRINITY_DN4854_c0_g1~~TRINITY_DN4854_c0_g1_i1.p1  ORF type:complete len:260 (-),score=36.08 TRINITY_DN4854_c0_g1_i1:59-778(-)